MCPCVLVYRGSREYEEILNFINEQITPHLRLALRAVGALRCAPWAACVLAQRCSLRWGCACNNAWPRR